MWVLSLTILLFLHVVINAQLPPDDPKDIVFPKNQDTQIFIPASAILYQRNSESKFLVM